MEVPSDSIILGKSIAEINLPPKLLIVLLKRGLDVFAPRGGTIFQKGDVLMILAEEDELDKAIALINQIAQKDDDDIESEEALGEANL